MLFKSLVPKVFTFGFGLAVSLMLNTQPVNASENTQLLDGGRIALCGTLQMTDHDVTLDLGDAGGLIPIKMSPELAAKAMNGATCVASRELPAQDGSPTEIYAANFFGDLATSFGGSLQEFQKTAGAVQVCGQIAKDGSELAIQFGQDQTQQVYLFSNEHTARIKNERRFPGPWCAIGERLPHLNTSGRLEFEPVRVRNESVKPKSGFSVGN